ncbi:MAG: pyridoxamine 5'-phosphate oxidase family protein [Clostridia bacterium]|nr:pyridoxamine 5'-phosphate oxidase family protein [Clostridia bacterium]
MSSKEKVLQVLKNHNLVSIATVDANGLPRVRSVDYALGGQEGEIVFITHKLSDKVKEISNNNNVYIVIDHDCDSMAELQQLTYIRGAAKAYISETPEEVQKVFGAILQKFPYLKDLPGEPSDFVGVRVELSTVKLIDNTVGFGYSEEVNLRG